MLLCMLIWLQFVFAITSGLAPPPAYDGQSPGPSSAPAPEPGPSNSSSSSSSRHRRTRRAHRSSGTRDERYRSGKDSILFYFNHFIARHKDEVCHFCITKGNKWNIPTVSFSQPLCAIGWTNRLSHLKFTFWLSQKLHFIIFQYFK